MAAIAGVKTQKNTKGQLTHITVDVRKHKEVLPILTEIGLISKTKFDLDFEKGISIEESRKRSLNYIKEIWKK